MKCHLSIIFMLTAEVRARKWIIGGHPEPISAHPSALQLYKKSEQESPFIKNPKFTLRDNADEKKDLKIHCGAVLISEWSAITAAHCLYNGVVFVESGHGSSDHKTQECAPSHQKKHPNYSSIYMSSDIAVLNMEKRVKFSINVYPVKMPFRMPVNNRPSTVCGWGSTSYPSLDYPEDLMCADNTILDKTNCINIYGTQIKPGMVCATSPTFEQDACVGDSGGPLFDWFSYEIDSHGCVHEEVVGLVSWGQGCGTAPGVYTDVFYFKDWIQQNAKDCLYCDTERTEGKCISVDQE